MRCYKVCVVLMLVCLLAVHDGLGQRRPDTRANRRRDRQRVRLAELARATTAFGMSLYRQTVGRNPGTNVVFSPFSVFTALTMTMLGSQGPTKEQLRAVMAQRPRQGIHSALHAAFASFPSSSDANVTMNVANAIYYNDTLVTMSDSFVRSLRTRYGAYPIPFEFPQPEVPINEWVLRQTHGKIKDFLNPGEISPDTIMMLLNAIFFKGKWKDEFKERYTREGDFTTASGDVVRVPMMNRDGDYSVRYPSDTDSLQAMVLELPYGTDNRFSMFILMPTQPDGMRDLEEHLNSYESLQSLEEVLTAMPAPSRYALTMPKFKLRTKTSLKRVLEAMGLTKFFRNASFQRMVRYPSPPMAASDVKHEAVIEVDEKGTTAAAVMSVEIVLESLPPSFVVDRPFIFVLRDKKSRINLFMGRLADPSRME